MTLAAQLTQTISASVPIVGVSIGDPNDKATWKVQFAPGATKADQDTAAAIVAAFDPTAPATVSAGKDLDANAIDTDFLIQAVGLALWEELQKCQVIGGQTLRTKPQLLARVKAIYRTLL